MTIPNCSSPAPETQPTVSVLVPTYNRERYIGECLDSILAQTVRPLQVIVIDDGSTDSTQEILHTYSNRITCLRQENAGKSAALNHGLTFATGEYVWIFDDDDVALPNSIERRLKLLEERGDIDFVYSGHCFGRDGDDGKIVRGRSYTPPVLEDRHLTIALMEGCFFTQQSVLARRRCYARVGPFDETFARGQDYEMLIRMARQCRGMGLADPTFVFRRHEGTRGPGAALHSSQDRDRVWMGFEHRIGWRIREDIALGDYLAEPGYGFDNDRKQQRHAFLQRMAIMASKGLSDEVVADLLDAVALDPTNELDEQSVAMCRRAITREFMQVALRMEPGRFLKRVQPLSACRAGRDALRALARGLFWVARQKDADRIGRGRSLWLCARLFGFSVAGKS